MKSPYTTAAKADSPRRAVKLRHMAISYVLLAAIVFLGLPIESNSQATTDDLLAATGSPVSFANEADPTISKMSVGSLSELRAMSADEQSSTGVAMNRNGDPVLFTFLHLEYATPAARMAVFSNQKVSRIAGATAVTVSGRFADVFVASDEAWEAVEMSRGLVRVEYGAKVNAPPPPPGTSTPLVSQAIPETIVRGGRSGLTGKNTIVAVLDTGIDFRHPDFITYDQQGRPTSRLKYLWDTSMAYIPGRGSMSPVRFPNGGSIGTLFTRDQLTAELRSATVNIPGTDLQGHGTACAGIAVGNGNGDKGTDGLKRPEVVGVAPDADIIGITMGFAGGFENSYLLNPMVEWLDKTAGATPLVISGSFGGHYSGHDGQTVLERHLNDRLPLTKVGRALVLAAGNEGSAGIHSEIKFSKEPKLVSWNAKRATKVRIYMGSDDKGLVLMASKATPLGENLKVELNPLTKQYSAVLSVAPGIGGIWFTNTGDVPSEAHLYFFHPDHGSFSPESVSYTHLVGAPGNTENAITVGSYSWNDNFHSRGSVTTLGAVCRTSSGGSVPFEIGFLSCYSSPGPNRAVAGKASVVKPEIVAPGEWYSASLAKVPKMGPVTGWRYDSTGNYAAMNGTSSATPYTSGIIALMLQKNPKLTLGAIKTLLMRHTTKSGLQPFSSALPNNNWGYGKLDVAAVDRILSSL